MADETVNSEQAMADRLAAIFKNKVAQAALVDHVVRNKPIGWNRKSSSPYYKERYALEIKRVLDKIKETGKPFCFRYEWFEKTFGLSKDTLYLRVYQSIRYLKEQLDPTREYAQFLERVEVTRPRGVGVLIALKKEYTQDGPVFEPEEVTPESEGPRWRRRMQEWLESDDDGSVFKQEGLMLSLGEIESLQMQLSTLSNVMASITSHSVKLVKMNPE